MPREGEMSNGWGVCRKALSFLTTAKGAYTANEAVAESASTPDETVGMATSPPDEAVAMVASTADEAVAEGASTPDKGMGMVTSTLDEAVVEVASTVDEVASDVASHQPSRHLIDFLGFSAGRPSRWLIVSLPPLSQTHWLTVESLV